MFSWSAFCCVLHLKYQVVYSYFYHCNLRMVLYNTNAVLQISNNNDGSSLLNAILNCAYFNMQYMYLLWGNT